MREAQGLHPDEEQIEQYALGVLEAVAIPMLEQHLLTCHACQDRVADMDAEIQGIQAAARELRAEDALRRSKVGTCKF